MPKAIESYHDVTVSSGAHESLKLFTTEEKFYVMSSGSLEVMEIDRLNFDIKLISEDGVPVTSKTKSICLVFGIIHLLAGPYLIIVTKKNFVGSIEGHSVYEVAETDLISFSKTNIHLSESQERDNQTYLSMIQHVLSKPGFYFSYNYDLTHSVQRRHHLSQTKPNILSLPLHERADERFMWNAHLLQDLVVLPELRRFVVPVLHGFVFIKKCTINGKVFVFSLISRRSTERAGVRYYMRGVDGNGSVANYIETEQVILYNGYILSFVQTRGSIPLQWSQRPSLKYKPNPVLSNTAEQRTSLQKHFDQQITHYGQQVIINLIDHKGPEKMLGENFQLHVQSLSSCLIWYEAFDFHKECSKMRWNRLSLLIDKLDPKQAEFGYFMSDQTGMVVSVQLGVFRTNCMDCLDRTNVVQSMLAHKSVQEQLRKLKVLDKDENVEEKSEFESIFKNVWADNADFCAKQYTGTGALKTDFTRSGKRTFYGLIKDGYNSAIRYYYNNFSDGYRQDAIDVFLGNYIIDRWEHKSRLQVQRSWKFRLFPIILLITISMLFMSLLIPSTDHLLQTIYVLFWSASVIGALIYVLIHGKEFVDIPRLAHSSDMDRVS